MENNAPYLKVHPQFLDILFAYKSTLSKVFKEVIGLHDLDHIALAQINRNNEIVSLSSTPALEFNLFRGGLWRYDQTYNPQWFTSGQSSNWQSLYYPARYDELYYLKQSKHSYPIGMSMTQVIGERSLIYSFATHNPSEQFLNRTEEMKKIGHYCALELHTVFNRCDRVYEDELAISA